MERLQLNLLNVSINTSEHTVSEISDPYNVIDGNVSTSPYECSCCFLTKNADNTRSWITIDLKQQYLVQQIRIIGRNDGKCFKLSLLLLLIYNIL